MVNSSSSMFSTNVKVHKAYCWKCYHQYVLFECSDIKLIYFAEESAQRTGIFIFEGFEGIDLVSLVLKKSSSYSILQVD